MEKVVLGFSGGLDTTYCVKYLTEDKGLEVHSVVVNTGGFDDAELKKMQTILVDEQEMEKIKNKVESSMAFEDLNLLNRANNLAFYELLGDAAMMNGEDDGSALKRQFG